MDIISIRHFLHSIAEKSGSETNSAAFISEQLRNLGINKIKEHIGGNSLLAEAGNGKGNKTVLFRCDIDAVEANEYENKPYCSKNKGTAHLCGHDGHSAIMLYFAYLLQQKPIKDKNILLLFQAEEETGQGAKKVMESGILDGYSIDAAFAMHNIPQFEEGMVITNNSCFSCAARSLWISFEGKVSHASEPELSVSSFDMMLAMKKEIESMENRDFPSDDFFQTTLIEFSLGEKAYGVTAANGILRFTFRTKTNTLLEENTRKIIQIIKTNIAKNPAIKCEYDFVESFAANENDITSVQTIVSAAKQQGMKTIELKQPFRWGEDFGLFTQKYKGAMFGIGSGLQCSSLHSSSYDFNDAIIEPSARLFYRIAQTV